MVTLDRRWRHRLRQNVVQYRRGPSGQVLSFYISYRGFYSATRPPGAPRDPGSPSQIYLTQPQMVELGAGAAAIRQDWAFPQARPLWGFRSSAGCVGDISVLSPEGRPPLWADGVGVDEMTWSARGRGLRSRRSASRWRCTCSAAREVAEALGLSVAADPLAAPYSKVEMDGAGHDAR